MHVHLACSASRLGLVIDGLEGLNLRAAMPSNRRGETGGRAKPYPPWSTSATNTLYLEWGKDF